METKLTVWHWLGISEMEFRKKSEKEVCVVYGCGKPTKLYENLCIGHKIAYRRWRNKQLREFKCFDIATSDCPECGHNEARVTKNYVRCKKCGFRDYY